MTKKDNKKGFTIIEVVLVLAIAGLIFAMVFIALPALQRSQRDHSRENDASVVAAAITKWNSSWISPFIFHNMQLIRNRPSWGLLPATS